MVTNQKWTVLLIFLVTVQIYSFQMILQPRTPKSVVLLSSASTRSSESTVQQLPSLEPPKEFLKIMTSSRTTEETKKQILGKLQSIRVNMNRGSGEQPQPAYAEYMDSLLVEIDSVRNNLWACRRRFPIPLPSFKMKLGSCRRVLQMLVDEQQTYSTDSSANGNILDQERTNRRRRALAVLLNQLVTQRNGIRGLESEALRRLKRSTMTEMLARTPPGLETPSYQVIDAKQTWEVRRYAPFSVCSTVLTSNNTPKERENTNANFGFNTLAGYIFGKNVENKPMAMTTPVISTGDMGGPRKKMSFIMPSTFWDKLVDAPKPMSGSGVQLEVSGGGLLDATDTIAVLWFGGYATADKVRSLSQELISEIDQDVKWKVKDGEDIRLFQYNDPFQPPWKRRNEVAIPVILRAS